MNINHNKLNISQHYITEHTETYIAEHTETYITEHTEAYITKRIKHYIHFIRGYLKIIFQEKKTKISTTSTKKTMYTIIILMQSILKKCTLLLL